MKTRCVACAGGREWLWRRSLRCPVWPARPSTSALRPADINACRPDQRFFYERVWPEFLGREDGGKHCNDSGCHDSGSPRQLRIPAPTSVPMLPLPPDWAAAYKSVTEQMSCTNVPAAR